MSISSKIPKRSERLPNATVVTNEIESYNYESLIMEKTSKALRAHKQPQSSMIGNPLPSGARLSTTSN